MGSPEGRVTYGAGYEGEESSTVSNVGDTVQDAASNAVDTAQGVVSSAAETVQQTASAVVDTAQQATSAVTGAVAGKVDQVSDAAATRVEQLADTVAQTMYSGDTPAVQRQVAETTVNVLDRTAEYLREGDISLIVEDVRGVVRRHPLRSLVVGLGLGYLARGAFFPASGAQGQSSGGAQPRGGAPYMPPPRPVPVYSAAGYDTSYSATATGDLGVGASIPPVADVPEFTESTDMLASSTLSGAGGATFGDQSGTSGVDDTTLLSGGTDTLLADDLLPGDTLGTADNAIDFPTGSALDVDTGGVDALGLDAATLTTDEQFQVASDEASTPSTIDTMPSDDQLRNWDAGASGQSS